MAKPADPKPKAKATKAPAKGQGKAPAKSGADALATPEQNPGESVSPDVAPAKPRAMPLPKKLPASTPLPPKPRKRRKKKLPANKAVGEMNEEQIIKRRAMALELRLQGGTYRAIAEQMKGAGLDFVNEKYSHVAAYKDIQDEMSFIRENISDLAEDVRLMELARLDAMTAGVWDAAEGGDIYAIDAMLKLMSRRAKYLGIDSPKKVAQTNPDGTQAAPTATVVPMIFAEKYEPRTHDQITASITSILESVRARISAQGGAPPSDGDGDGSAQAVPDDVGDKPGSPDERPSD